MKFLRRFTGKNRSSTFAAKLILSAAGGVMLFAAAFFVPRSGDVVNIDDREMGGGPDSYFHHIYDPGHLLGPLGRTDLELDNFQRASGNAILFAAFPSLPSDDPYFTMRLADRWAPGKSRDDRGLVIFLFMKERRIRAEIGYGLEDVLTDVATARLVENTMVPLLREGKNSEAVEACARALQQGLPQRRDAGSGLRGIRQEMRAELPSYLTELKRRAALLIRVWKVLPLLPRLLLTGVVFLAWAGFVKLAIDMGHAFIKLMKFMRHAWVFHDAEGGKEALAGITVPLLGAVKAAVLIFIIGTIGEYFRSGTGMFGGGGVNLFW